MKKSAILITIFSIAALAHAQQNDTVKKIDLKEVIIQDYKTLSEMARMPDVKENVIYAGKKTEVIQLDKINADLSTIR